MPTTALLSSAVSRVDAAVLAVAQGYSQQTITELTTAWSAMRALLAPAVEHTPAATGSSPAPLTLGRPTLASRPHVSAPVSHQVIPTVAVTSASSGSSLHAAPDAIAPVTSLLSDATTALSVPDPGEPAPFGGNVNHGEQGWALDAFAALGVAGLDGGDGVTLVEGDQLSGQPPGESDALSAGTVACMCVCVFLRVTTCMRVLCARARGIVYVCLRPNGIRFRVMASVFLFTTFYAET